LYDAGDVRVCGFDIYASTHTDFVADAHRIPFADESFDAVWIQAVLEHVIEPHQVVAEIARVLRADGVVYAETPFMQQVHEGAYDFTRFTESGHRWLFRDFECLESGVVLGPGTASWWSLRYTLRALFRSHVLAEVLALPFFWLRFLDGLTSGVYASDAASGVYFFGKKGGSRLGPKELVAFYHRPRGH
jgi:SAM-dependent methyltransferase